MRAQTHERSGGLRTLCSLLAVRVLKLSVGAVAVEELVMYHGFHQRCDCGCEWLPGPRFCAWPALSGHAGSHARSLSEMELATFSWMCLRKEPRMRLPCRQICAAH